MNNLKKWQHHEIKKLLKYKPEGTRKESLKIAQTFEITFPYLELENPETLWSKAALLINAELTKYELMIRDIILSANYADWLTKKAKYQHGVL